MALKIKPINKGNILLLLTILVVIIICSFVFGIIGDKSSALVVGPVAAQKGAGFSKDSDNKITICIDPGHGGYDTGTISPSGIYEKDINLKVALRLGKILKKNDFNVIYTRTTDEMKGSTQRKDLRIRCAFANSADTDIYISLHCNFDEFSSNTRGTEVWCRFPNQQGEFLAACIDNRLTNSHYTDSRGIKYEADGKLFVLRNTDAVAVLVETGFLSNSTDCSFLNSDKGQDKCASAIARGIEDYTKGTV